MIKQYKTVYKGGQAEVFEKKSRFIANVFPVESEEEALIHIEKIKKIFWDARHNCFAYVLRGTVDVERCSDDGEPSGTAGKPMLDVLKGEKLYNVLVIVTRYFGGTLLGTGGLVRAYSHSTKEGLANSVVITKYYGMKLEIETNYTGLGKIQYILGKRNLVILDSTYEENVKVVVLIPEEEQEVVSAEIIEGSNGQAILRPVENCWFAKIDKEVVVFE